MLDSTVKLARDAKAGILDGHKRDQHKNDDPGQVHVRAREPVGHDSVIALDRLGISSGWTC